MMGKVFKYGDDVNTDVIFPGKYTYTVTEPNELAKHALEDLDPGFAENVEKGDVIVAGKNFGCGSSREQAASCLKYAGVAAIVAESFARIYYRNAINFGLPAIVCPEASKGLESGDEVEIDLSGGRIRAREKTFEFAPFPEFIMEIMRDGGLIPHIRKELESSGEA
jgi:3-isopropylmalate/(R)-2-methylmalate dehydratase small subunit